MARSKFYCTNCRHRFEAEEKEGLECPQCLWTTALQKEEDSRSAGAGPGPVIKAPEAGKSIFKIPALHVPPAASRFAFLFLIVAAVGASVLFGGQWFLTSAGRFWEARQSETVKPSKPQTASRKDLPAVPGPALTLTEGEKEILYRAISLPAQRVLSVEEKEVLQRVIPFRTGLVEKLPSQTWTLENYKKMIAEQEKFYKITLPGSYKGKLEDLFNQKYVPGDEAFQKGDLLQARNDWVESLTFPMYGKDLQKHRGVALTIIRPFINDTLSKIGAINTTLVEQTVRQKESAISAKYQELFPLLAQESWDEALGVIAEAEKMITELDSRSPLAAAAPYYPATVQQVDPDIQATLFDLLASPEPAVMDVNPLVRDLSDKKILIESLQPDGIKRAEETYRRALELIRQQKWEEAEQLLRQIAYPPEFLSDCQEKVQILKKLKQQGLDSSVKSS